MYFCDAEWVQKSHMINHISIQKSVLKVHFYPKGEGVSQLSLSGKFTRKQRKIGIQNATPTSSLSLFWS